MILFSTNLNLPLSNQTLPCFLAVQTIYNFRVINIDINNLLSSKGAQEIQDSEGAIEVAGNFPTKNSAEKISPAVAPTKIKSGVKNESRLTLLV
jgi:hypothetical protein